MCLCMRTYDIIMIGISEGFCRKPIKINKKEGNLPNIDIGPQMLCLVCWNKS